MMGNGDIQPALFYHPPPTPPPTSLSACDFVAIIGFLPRTSPTVIHDRGVRFSFDIVFFLKCILVGAALWAVHSIFTVDATIWRGWTVQGTSAYVAAVKQKTV